MTDQPALLRTDATPCLLFPAMLPRAGGLTRSLQERASLYARNFDRVLILTTGFGPRWKRVATEQKERGSLDPRVEVRNFFAHSSWVRQLGVPPEDAYEVPGESDIITRPQRYRRSDYLRLADFRPGVAHPFRFRYFDLEGRPLLSTSPDPESKHERRAWAPDGTRVSWPQILADWVDDEIADLTQPVLYSLQRGLNDPVLLASRRAARKIASLHNCHLNDPDNGGSGIRPSYRPLFANADKVDAIVCQTKQQESELRPEVPLAPLSSIGYPGRPARLAQPVEKDTSLVVLVAQLIERKRIDHAIRAFATVRAAVPGARLEIYGEGPLLARLQRLVETLGLESSVFLMGYSLTVGEAQARAACTLMTSTYEGSPRVVTESMSRGTPVIAYTCRYGPRDLIRDGVDGLLLADHQPDALAAAIVSLMSDPERALEMGRRASEVIDRFPLADFERAWCDMVTAPRKTPTVAARVSWLRLRLRRRLGRSRFASRLRPPLRARPPRPGLAPDVAATRSATR
jgi:glycosyltransferase involved in cell wall biosynthesis